jgi:hypothetical protein
MIKFIEKNKKDLVIEKEYGVSFDNRALVEIKKNQTLSTLFSNFSGSSFNNGLIKIHTLGSSFYWTEIVLTYFKEYSNKCYCFAFDWMGRQFAIGNKNGIDIVFMFDCCTGEVFEMEQSINGFFDEDLVDYIEDTLDTNRFESFLNMNNLKKIDFKKCISYKTPLFLGGIDNLTNLEICDLEVNWEINHQIFLKINPDRSNMQ